MLNALVVEDEPLMREYLLQHLTDIHSAWATSACARDGMEALALLKQHRYDLVITDIRMPRMDGIELAGYIHEHFPDTDIIILTGYDEFEYARGAMRAGVVEYLLKPLQDLELSDVLQKLAEKRHYECEVADGGAVTELLRDVAEAGRNGCKESADIAEGSCIIERVREYIKHHFKEPLSLTEIADMMQITPAYLSSIFKSAQGESYSKYVLRLRMEHAATLLRTNQAARIGDIAADLGYTSTKHFDEVFKKYYGITPKEYQGR